MSEKVAVKDLAKELKRVETLVRRNLRRCAIEVGDLEKGKALDDKSFLGSVVIMRLETLGIPNHQLLRFATNMVKDLCLKYVMKHSTPENSDESP